MEAFFQGLQTNVSVLVALFVLFVLMIKQGHRIDLAILRLDIAILRIDKMLKKHSRDIRRLKKVNRQSKSNSK